MNKEPLDSSKLNVTTRPLYQPPLEELMNVLTGGLSANFEEATVELGECPTEILPGRVGGICGNPIILDIGGPAYLLPLVQKDKFYDIETLLHCINYNSDAIVMGAGAGLWPHTINGRNCELIMQAYVTLQSGVTTKTNYALVDMTNGKCFLKQMLPNEHETTFALMANLYACEGQPGKILKVRAKKRTGQLDFITCMQKALENHYKDKLVGLGGLFMMKNGKVKQHVMPDYSDVPLNTVTELNNWLRFYDMKTPLTAVGTFVSAETDLDLRVQHFHSVSEVNQVGGHYHIDTTPDTIEYEGYFNVAATLYRVDQPSKKIKFGKD